MFRFVGRLNGATSAALLSNSDAGLLMDIHIPPRPGRMLLIGDVISTVPPLAVGEACSLRKGSIGEESSHGLQRDAISAHHQPDQGIPEDFGDGQVGITHRHSPVAQEIDVNRFSSLSMSKDGRKKGGR
jgi:hypothetical protein